MEDKKDKKTSPKKVKKDKKASPKKGPKQPIGYVWKVTNDNGEIKRELHPIYSASVVDKEMKKMRNTMNKMLKSFRI